MQQKPIVYICGSFKTLDQMTALKQSLLDKNIPTLISSPHDPNGIAGCFQRIDQCDILYVFNPNGEIGKSVATDLGYAIAKSKKIVSAKEGSDPPLRPYIQDVIAPAELVQYVDLQTKVSLKAYKKYYEDPISVQQGDAIRWQDKDSEWAG